MSQIEKKPDALAAPVRPVELSDEAVADLRNVVTIDEAAFSALLKAIAAAEPALTLPRLARKLAPVVPGASPEAIRSILVASVNLHAMRVRRSMSVADFVALVASSQALSKVFSPDSKSVFSDRLARLLDENPVLGITSKAHDVMTEQDHAFCNTRIVSDIRPVFSEDASRAQGAVIVHTLRIGYHQNGDHKDFYVAMDTNDIKKLKQAIERAEKKTAAMEAILKKADVSYIEV